MIDFNNVVSRASTKAFKTDFLGPIFGNPNALPLWVADMDFPAPEEVVNALINRAQHPIYGYTARPASYFQALKFWNKSRHNWETETKWCLHSPSVLTSLSLAIESLVPKNGKVVIQTPVYAPFYTLISRNQRIISENPLVLNSNNSYEMDFDHLEYLFANESKYFLFCHPHNPVGRVWNECELSRLAALVQHYGVTVFSDEIHRDLVFSSHKHIPLASLIDANNSRVVTCVSPTKTFNIAGIAASAIVVSNPEVRKVLESELIRYSVDAPNTFAIEAFEAAFAHGETWLNALVAYLEKNRDFLFASLKPFEHKVKMLNPEGTYLAWIDFRNCGWPADVLAKKLVKDAGVALEPGTKFGGAGEGFARLNFACPQSVLQEAVRRIQTIL